jgi:hypothetical protein
MIHQLLCIRHSYFLQISLYSSVSKLVGYVLNNWRLIPGRNMNISLGPQVRTSFVACLASYQTDR